MKDMIYMEENLFQTYYAELKRYPYFETKEKACEKKNYVSYRRNLQGICKKAWDT